MPKRVMTLKEAKSDRRRSKNARTSSTRSAKERSSGVAEVVSINQKVQKQASPQPKALSQISPERQKLYEECRRRLEKAKEEHLAHFDVKREAISEHIGGDDGDVAALAEEQDFAVSRRENILELLSEIEMAFERLKEGTYGICEETGELIEAERLLAIPWTRYSLEGAISREKELKQLNRKRA